MEEKQYISRIKLADGNIVDVKDSEARSTIETVVADIVTLNEKDTELASLIKENSDKVNALSSATHFLGVKDKLPTTSNKGDIIIVGNKEYVYDPDAINTVEDTQWVELGDTTAELAAINAIEEVVETILTDLSEDGDTTKAIAAAQATADAAQENYENVANTLSILSETVITNKQDVDNNFCKVVDGKLTVGGDVIIFDCGNAEEP